MQDLIFIIQRTWYPGHIHFKEYKQKERLEINDSETQG